MRKRNLNELGNDARNLRRHLVQSAEDAMDWAKEAIDVVENLEAELENAWQECSIREDKVDSLETEIMKLSEELKSHLCCIKAAECGCECCAPKQN